MSTSTKPTAADIVPGAIIVEPSDRFLVRRNVGHLVEILWWDEEERDWCPSIMYGGVEAMLSQAISVLPPTPSPEVPHDRP